jgi:hypothetical protein
MLTEFAFTPAIFDEDAHEDKEAWRDQLRELIAAMFPRTSVWHVVVSDLYAGSWSPHVIPHVERIQDHRAKKYCQDMLTNMKRMLVVRPECGDWPHEDDVAWCREAVATHQVEPIDRIVSVKATRTRLAEEFAFIRSIDEVEDAGFWRGIKSDASPRMVIAEQVDLLRKLCLHSEWVALINRYGFTSEEGFSLKLLESILGRHASFGPIHFELHAQAPDITDPVERQERQQRVANYMVSQIQPKLTGSSSVELYFWPSLRERILVAGNYVQQSGGQKRKSPRWGVGMQHVAHGSDGQSDDTEWKLLRRNSLDTWFRRIAAENASGKPTPTIISPVP